MPRRARLALLAALALLIVVTPAAAGMADRLAATFELMADDFIRVAQPIEGVVAAYEGNVLYLDLGEDSGAQVGQELIDLGAAVLTQIEVEDVALVRRDGRPRRRHVRAHGRRLHPGGPAQRRRGGGVRGQRPLPRPG